LTEASLYSSHTLYKVQSVEFNTCRFLGAKSTHSIYTTGAGF